MRVLVLHSRYRSGSSSGENRVVEDETRLLESGGHEVHVWAPSYPADRGTLRGAANTVWSRGAASQIARLIAEARDRQDPVGRMVISETLNAAMAERSANSALYVSKSRAGLAKEIGEWAEGTAEGGAWIACTHEHLVTAVRILVVQERLQQIRAAVPSLDASSIANQIQRIRTTLGRIKTINTKVTDVRSSADEIQREAEAVREEIRSALNVAITAASREPSWPTTDASRGIVRAACR